jgi:hypothetical protein
MRPFSLYLSKKNNFRVLFFLSGRSPGTIWPLAKPFSRFILYRAGCLEQFDHSRNPFRVLFFLSGRSPGTIRPLAKPISHFILIMQVAWNNLTTRETLFAFYSLSGRSPGTIWPLAKPFSRFILPIRQVAWNNLTTRETLFAFYSSYRAGRLEQLDHSRNPFRVLFFIG